jgi:hypothetical protein
MANRRFWQWLFAIGLVVALARVTAAPAAALDCGQVAITAPRPGATVSGAVDVLGRAVVPALQFYKVEYSPVAREQWVLIGTDIIRQAVPNGRLVLWQSTTVPDGSYRLRLRVVDPTGNYCEAVVSPIQVANARPVETAEATPTETPMLTVVPPQPTPTLPPTVAIEVVPVQITPGALPTRVSTLQLPPASDFVVTGVFFLLGVFGMLAIALAVGAVMLVRSLSRRTK